MHGQKNIKERRTVCGFFSKFYNDR